MPSILPKLLTEFVGTFFLVLIIALAVGSASDLAPLIIGVGLMTLVYMGGAISGAHYNPAVTLAILVRGKITPGDAVAYVVAQCIAGGGGAAVGAYLNGPGKAPVVPTLGKDVPMMSAAIAETLFTFLLALVVLNVATSKKQSGNGYFGAAIGLVVATAAVCIGGVSGAVLNPAVGLGLCVLGGKFDHLPLYIVAPLAGGLIAALFYRIQHTGAAD